ncbi:MAG: M1 family metallopeptidase, partial [Deltaproteobacteria bacterium]|nr:M1 family metallopeptidase [Deltaproteobacteria bacterium]
MTTTESLLHAARSGSFSRPDARPHYAPELRLEPAHLDITLTVDLDVRSLEGTVTIRLRANDEGATAIDLDAVDFLELSVEDAAGKALRHAYDGARLSVVYEEPFARGEERELRVSYRVEKPISGVLFGGPTPASPNAGRFALTDNETERARHWLPCVDQPAVRPTLSFHLR